MRERGGGGRGRGEHTSPCSGSATSTNALEHSPKVLKVVDPVIHGQEVSLKDRTFVRLLRSQQELYRINTVKEAI